MTKTTATEGESADGAKKKPARAKAPTKAPKPKAAAAKPKAKTAPKAKAPKAAKPAAKKKVASKSKKKVADAVELVADDVAVDAPEVEVEVEAAPVVEAAPALVLSPEEQELAAIYGDDLAAPATAHAEYRDQQTADEDRPMMPEINARDERKQMWKDRREHRRQRRGGGGGGGGENRDGGRGGRDGRDRDRDRAAHSGDAQRAGGAQQPQPPRPPAQGVNSASSSASPGSEPRPLQPPVPVNHEHDTLKRVGTPLGDAAATVFAQLRNGQPLPVRQLAAMMRKRNLVESDPEQLAPQLKAELLGDERSYRALGLRPRIVYRGRDLFAPGPVSMSRTADAEAEIAAALSRLAGATHRALAQRVTKATPAGFERLIHGYLVAAGYREIDWVKRVGGISYAAATAPGISRTVLISARPGAEPIDRRGIGELRMGVEAKGLVAGMLFSPGELSEDAERELERGGRSIAVMCGDQLVAALIASGVGVVSSAAPLHYVDDQLLDELLAG